MIRQIESIEELHDIFYDILIVIDDICNKNHIKYFLSGGTCLGAVRDKNFIAWDDDMDLEIIAEEWPKLKKALETELPEYMKIVYPNDYKNLFYDFVIRIVDTRYTIRGCNEKDDAYANKINYVGTDVFLWHQVSNRKLFQHMFILGYKILYGLAMGHRYKLDYHKYNLCGKLQVLILSSIGKRLSYEKIYDNYCHYVMRYSNIKHCRFRICLSAPFQYIKPYPEYLWDEVAYGTIRNRSFPVVGDYDTRLKLAYGDYMKKPEKLEKYEQHMDENFMNKKKELLDKYRN